MKHTIHLTYGDPSGDGHGISETETYNSNYKATEIRTAYIKAKAETGFDFDLVASGYEECCLSLPQYNTLAELLNVDPYVEHDEDWIQIHDFTGLYLAFVKTQLPDLEVEFQPTNWVDHFDIGGYGMCSTG